MHTGAYYKPETRTPQGKDGGTDGQTVSLRFKYSHGLVLLDEPLKLFEAYCLHAAFLVRPLYGRLAATRGDIHARPARVASDARGLRQPGSRLLVKRKGNRCVRKLRTDACWCASQQAVADCIDRVKPAVAVAAAEDVVSWRRDGLAAPDASAS